MWLASGQMDFPLRAQSNPPKNIILFIGDGMGFEQIKAASFYAHGEAGQLTMESAPYQAQMTTESDDGFITDSAAAGTAMATGVKVSNGAISVTGAGGRQELETSLEHYQKRCKSSGLVVTSYLNHATPAVFAAHAASRTELVHIAQDYFTQTRPNILYGGAAAGLYPEIASQNGYTVVTDREGMMDVTPTDNAYIFGYFNHGHMDYEYNYASGESSFYDTMPHLSEMTANALEILDKDDDGFFLMVEGSRIDHGGHENHLGRTIYETLEFDEAVSAAIEWAADRDDTLIVVTADHETGGLEVTQNNGQGEWPDARWSTQAHTASTVPVFAWGPNSELVSGLLDNTDIFEITTANSGPEAEGCGDEPSDETEDASVPEEPLAVITDTPTPTNTPSPSPFPTSTLMPSPTPSPTPMPPMSITVFNEPSEWIAPGGEVTYTIQYQVGAEALNGVILHSQVPENVQLLEESIQWGSASSIRVVQARTSSAHTPMVEWQLGDLPAGSSGIAAYRVKRPGAAEAPTHNGMLDIAKHGPQAASVGMPITYTLTITNYTSEQLRDIFVVDTLPFGATYQRGGDSPPVDGQLAWWLEKLEPGSVNQLAYVVTSNRTLMSGPYRVYNLNGLGSIQNNPIVTTIGNNPLPVDGDGFFIRSEDTGIKWRLHGAEQQVSSPLIQNPTYQVFLPYKVQ
ncbi:MAG: alkaline phosphatase [Chloroflexota bacterium]